MDSKSKTKTSSVVDMMKYKTASVMQEVDMHAQSERINSRDSSSKSAAPTKTEHMSFYEYHERVRAIESRDPPGELNTYESHHYDYNYFSRDACSRGMFVRIPCAPHDFRNSVMSYCRYQPELHCNVQQYYSAYGESGSVYSQSSNCHGNTDKYSVQNDCAVSPRPLMSDSSHPSANQQDRNVDGNLSPETRQDISPVPIKRRSTSSSHLRKLDQDSFYNCQHSFYENFKVQHQKILHTLNCAVDDIVVDEVLSEDEPHDPSRKLVNHTAPKTGDLRKAIGNVAREKMELEQNLRQQLEDIKKQRQAMEEQILSEIEKESSEKAVLEAQLQRKLLNRMEKRVMMEMQMGQLDVVEENRLLTRTPKSMCINPISTPGQKAKEDLSSETSVSSKFQSGAHVRFEEPKLKDDNSTVTNLSLSTASSPTPKVVMFKLNKSALRGNSSKSKATPRAYRLLTITMSQPGTLGLEIEEGDDAVSSACVTRVVPGSLGDASGVKKGDVLCHADSDIEFSYHEFCRLAQSGMRPLRFNVRRVEAQPQVESSVPGRKVTIVATESNASIEGHIEVQLTPAQEDFKSEHGISSEDDSEKVKNEDFGSILEPGTNLALKCAPLSEESNDVLEDDGEEVEKEDYGSRVEPETNLALGFVPPSEASNDVLEDDGEKVENENYGSSSEHETNLALESVPLSEESNDVLEDDGEIVENEDYGSRVEPETNLPLESVPSSETSNAVQFKSAKGDQSKTIRSLAEAMPGFMTEKDVAKIVNKINQYISGNDEEKARGINVKGAEHKNEEPLTSQNSTLDNASQVVDEINVMKLVNDFKQIRNTSKSALSDGQVQRDIGNESQEPVVNTHPEEILPDSMKASGTEKCVSKENPALTREEEVKEAMKLLESMGYTKSEVTMKTKATAIKEYAKTADTSLMPSLLLLSGELESKSTIPTASAEEKGGKICVEVVIPSQRRNGVNEAAVNLSSEKSLQSKEVKGRHCSAHGKRTKKEKGKQKKSSKEKRQSSRGQGNKKEKRKRKSSKRVKENPIVDIQPEAKIVQEELNVLIKGALDKEDKENSGNKFCIPRDTNNASALSPSNRVLPPNHVSVGSKQSSPPDNCKSPVYHSPKAQVTNSKSLLKKRLGKEMTIIVS